MGCRRGNSLPPFAASPEGYILLMKRLYFIVNPVAGAGRAGSGFRQICGELDRRGMDYGFEFTRGPGHGAALAKEALSRGEEYIIAAGGDGTVGEVASAMAGSGRIMGILPLGTGNDFSKALGLCTDPLGALDTVLQDNPVPTDAGMANDRLFVNVAGMGFDVDVLLNVDKYKEKFRGMLPYLIGIAKSLMGLRSLHLTIDDGERKFSRDVTIISVGNGTHFGGGMNVTPHADPRDGLLDICIVRKVSKLRFMRLLPLFIKGRHTHRKEVEYFRAKEIFVECDKPCIIDCDGELINSTPVRFRILPGALNLLVNRE